MRWLVTGATGFLGSAVVDALRAGPQAAEVLTIQRSGSPARDRIVADLERIEPTDLTAMLGARAPGVVIHCAGKTPPASPETYWRANTRATWCLLEACARLARPPRVVLAGSAAELGPVPLERLPVDERCVPRPRDAYGLSKWACTQLAVRRFWEGGIEVIVGRVFNPIGPGLPISQVFGRFARLLSRSLDGPVEIRVGDLEARRDFVDVRDTASALVALALEGRHGEIYHVGTGCSHSIGDGLGGLLRISGRCALLRPSDLPGTGALDSRADIGKITRETSWRPTTSFEQSLADLWRASCAEREIQNRGKQVA